MQLLKRHFYATTLSCIPFTYSENDNSVKKQKEHMVGKQN